MKYSKIRDDLRTGDIIGFSGWSPGSLLIRLITWSWWSHVGMVYRIGNDVFCWESTRMTGKDGVQMSLLSNRIASYKGKVAIRRLFTRRDNQFYSTIRELRGEMKGKKYERHIKELLGSALPWQNKVCLIFIFCSELIALAFKRWKLLGHRMPENEYKPGDFAQGGIVDRQMVTGSYLGPKIPIEM